jgi:predicted MFS family arabinose efflux permease
MLRSILTVRGLGAGLGPALAGLAASLVGIGLARFGYSALIPALVQEGWFGGAAAAYLGAANFTGYLAGALLADRMAMTIPSAALLRGMMLAVSLSFLACAAPLPFAWFFAWRFVAGYAGGVLMVLAAPAILSRVPASRRGAVGGIIFSGVGIGIVLAALLVPALVRLGLGQAWLALGILSLALTAHAWRRWPAEPIPHLAKTDEAGLPRALPVALKGLCLAYALNAVALVPHFVFLVDYVARGAGRGLEAGAQAWVLFGLGALIGPLLAGLVADRIGFARALRWGLAAQAATIAVPALTAGVIPVAVSGFLVGALTPGIVPLVLGRVRELAAGEDHRRAWGLCTSAFAFGQAGAGYGYSYLFDATDGSYRVLFAIGASAVALALAVESATARADKGRHVAAGRAGSPSDGGKAR